LQESRLIEQGSHLLPKQQVRSLPAKTTQSLPEQTTQSPPKNTPCVAKALRERRRNPGSPRGLPRGVERSGAKNPRRCIAPGDYKLSRVCADEAGGLVNYTRTRLENK